MRPPRRRGLCRCAGLLRCARLSALRARLSLLSPLPLSLGGSPRLVLPPLLAAAAATGPAAHVLLIMMTMMPLLAAAIGRLVGATRSGRRRLLLDALARELGDDELRQVERLRASFQTQNT